MKILIDKWMKFLRSVSMAGHYFCIRTIIKLPLLSFIDAKEFFENGSCIGIYCSSRWLEIKNDACQNHDKRQLDCPLFNPSLRTSSCKITNPLHFFWSVERILSVMVKISPIINSGRVTRSIPPSSMIWTYPYSLSLLFFVWHKISINIGLPIGQPHPLSVMTVFLFQDIVEHHHLKRDLEALYIGFTCHVLWYERGHISFCFLRPIQGLIGFLQKTAYRFPKSYGILITKATSRRLK